MLISINMQTGTASIGIQVAAQVLYSIALGPLLSSTLSFINVSAPTDDTPAYMESYRKRGLFGGVGRSRWLRLAHILIILGLVLGIVGGVDRAPSSSTGKINHSRYDNGATLLKVSVFLFLSALLAIAWGLCSQWSERLGLRKMTRMIMAAVAVSLPFILIRLIYSFLSDFNLDTTTNTGHPDTFNSFTGSWVVYLFLVLFPQLIVVIAYNVAGTLGRHGKDHGGLKTTDGV